MLHSGIQWLLFAPLTNEVHVVFPSFVAPSQSWLFSWNWNTHRQTCWATSESLHSDCFSLFGIVVKFCGSVFSTIRLCLGCDCRVLLGQLLLELITCWLLKYSMYCGFSGVRWIVLKEHFSVGDLYLIHWPWAWKLSSLYSDWVFLFAASLCFFLY